MSVSKSLRFQVLRRDGHRCRYCGRGADQVALVVDHVIPEALGGATVPENLAASCGDCNSGKSAVPPDAEMVKQVSRETQIVAIVLEGRAERLLDEIRASQGDRDRFEKAWSSSRIRSGLPLGWVNFVDRMRTAGMPIDVLIDCITVAEHTTNVPQSRKFNYMCGVAYNRVKQITSEIKWWDLWAAEVDLDERTSKEVSF